MEQTELKKMHGIIPIMQTAFKENGEVDLEGMERMTDATIRDGAGGIALFGYGTEFYKLSDEERVDMVKACVKAADGRKPVIASVTAGSTEVAVKTAKQYEALGVDAIMALSPSVIAPSTPALAEHFLEIYNSVNLPSVIQYTPASGGGKLNAETIHYIGEHCKNEMYIKAESVPVAPLIDALREQTKGKIGLFSGNMCLHMIDLMDRGTTGFMPGVSLVPMFNEIFKAYYYEHDRDKAQKIYDMMLPMVMVINQDIETLVRYEKMLMVKRGIIKSSYCRKPTAHTCDERMWKMFDEYRTRLSEQMFVGEDYE